MRRRAARAGTAAGTAALRARDWLLALFEDDPPSEPGYDPVHLGTAIVATLAALGCLYWLLWTLLVYEGGIFLKVQALGRLAGGATLRELGYEGSYALGAFEGWFGNLAALAFTIGIALALRRLYREAASRRR
ncbi:MAG: hypothetical protein HY554_15940 [Elusimicrobia bacterium]|nr:hypothetical protein [Elusimicrobiota bacterium]